MRIKHTGKYIEKHTTMRENVTEGNRVLKYTIK